jgi:hypothetical protein
MSAAMSITLTSDSDRSFERQWDRYLGKNAVYM